MKEDAPRVIKIPAKPEATRQAEARRQLRVAAYCRVSTKEEDQANSYEVQKEYYTDKIMSNTAWTMAGIFADKGITGTSAKKREDFMRMIRHCRQKKIDVILTKSVSRFSRNTVDCLYYIRALKQLGIAVIFEKENINSLEEDSELRITLSGAFAQSESESISANVTWGKRRAMEAGKVSIQYKKLYGYRKGEDGQPEIIPEQAEIVRWLYERYLTGASLRMIKEELEQQGVKCFEDSPEWTISRIRSILQNEKYCGDVLIDRALETYLKKGYSREWINQRLQAIQVRKELTDEWDARGVQKGVEYAILTDEISRAWSGMSTRQYKNLKGLKKENLRDNMTTLELVLNMLAEATTTQFSRDRKPTTFQENLAVAKAGGQVAGRTRKDIESQSDTPVITAKNAAQLNQVVTDLLEGAVSDTTEESKDK